MEIKSFIICLSKIQSSIETALNLEKQLNNFNMPVELFEGTYGDDAVRQMDLEGRTVHPIGFKGEQPAGTVPSPRSLAKVSRPGVKGCFYSHYNLWKKCVALDEPIIIWEDDIVLTRPLLSVEWQDVLILALGHPAKSLEFLPYLEKPTKPVVAMPYRRASMPGCCGYAIKPHAALKLCKEYANTYLAADNAINQRVVKIQIHNHIMGIALVKKDGKISLTRSTHWKI